MYGWINGCLEDEIVRRFGSEIWNEIKKAAGVETPSGDFFRNSFYTDESTFHLLQAGSKLLNSTVEDLLIQLGRNFIHYLEVHGYGRTMRCQGRTFREWIRNINEPHRLLRSRFPRSSLPEFWLEDNLEDDTNDSVILHYLSQRCGELSPIVVGIVKEAALYYFSVNIHMEDYHDTTCPTTGKYHGYWTVRGLNQENVPSPLSTSSSASDSHMTDDAQGVNPAMSLFDTSPSSNPHRSYFSTDNLTDWSCPFHRPQVERKNDKDTDGSVESKTLSGDILNNISPVSNQILDGTPQSVNPSVSATIVERKVSAKSIGVSGQILKRVFPFHLVINQDLQIVQLGNKLRNIATKRWKLPEMLNTFVGDHYQITIPSHFVWSWDGLRNMQNTTIEISLVAKLVNKAGNPVSVKFRGEVAILDGEEDDMNNVASDEEDDISPVPQNTPFKIRKPSSQPAYAAFFIIPDITNMDELLSLDMQLNDLPRHGFQADMLLIDEHLKSETSYSSKLQEISKSLDLESRKAKEALKMKRIFVRYVSHEIRTPLNIAILGLKCLENELAESYQRTNHGNEDLYEEDVSVVHEDDASLQSIIGIESMHSTNMQATTRSLFNTPLATPRSSVNQTKPNRSPVSRPMASDYMINGESIGLETSTNLPVRRSELNLTDLYDDESPIPTILDEIKTSCAVAVDILNDLLLYEKIDNGIFDIAKHPTNLHELLEESIKLFSVQARGAEVDFTMDDYRVITEGKSCIYGFQLASSLYLPATSSDRNRHNISANFSNYFTRQVSTDITPTQTSLLPNIMTSVDRSKIQQVLRNLFTNAVKFTPAGGRVTLSYAIFGADIDDLHGTNPNVQPMKPAAFPHPDEKSLFETSFSSNSESDSDSYLSAVNFASLSSAFSMSFTTSAIPKQPPVSIMPTGASSGTVSPRVPSLIFPSQSATESSRAFNLNDLPITFAEDIPDFPPYFARISISDSGAGISAKDQATLFHEFIQVKADQLQNGQGSGLGLWIAATVMKMHGGRIGVASAGEGQGATFFVDIPILTTNSHPSGETVSSKTSHENIIPRLQSEVEDTFSSRDGSAAGPISSKPIHDCIDYDHHTAVASNMIALAKASSLRKSRSQSTDVTDNFYSKLQEPSILVQIPESVIHHITLISEEREDISAVVPLDGKVDREDVELIVANILVKLEAEKDDVNQNSLKQDWKGMKDFLSALPLSERTFFESFLMQHFQRYAKGMANVESQYCSVPSSSPSPLSPFSSFICSRSTLFWRPRQILSAARVLIVDDAASNRKMVRRLLQRTFRSLDEAENGLVAVEKFSQALSSATTGNAVLKNTGYDLILMDFMMPHMNGPDATTLIKEIAKKHHHPVTIIGVTGNGLLDDIATFEAHGADQVMVKPLEYDHFMRFLHTHPHFLS